ncbi:MAG: hypothetical protein QME78_15245 [Thermodesulfobacteriota bacterium]|nr:hypothetical protein [Thermodesulfobacteriota bacterium]
MGARGKVCPVSSLIIWIIKSPIPFILEGSPSGDPIEAASFNRGGSLAEGGGFCCLNEELVIQNQTLELSREILDHLPVAIIGVSKEGMIFLANPETQRLPLSGKTICLGEDVSDYFSDGVGAAIAAALEIHTPQVLSNYWISGKPY